MRYSLIGCGVLLAASLVALLLARRLQRLVVEPITHLAQVVREVKVSRSYSIRAVKAGRDEVGRLIEGFNEMLSEIQQRDSALQTAQDGLEKRVVERTAELARSLSVLNATLDSTADGILAVQDSGEVLCYNRQFAAMWDVPEEVMQRKDGAEVAELLRTRVCPAMPSRNEGAAPRNASEVEPMPVVELLDGRVFERFVKAQYVDGHAVGVVVNYRDITERRKAEQALRERTQLAEMEAAARSAWTRGETLAETLQICCEAIVRHLDGAFARIWILNEREQMLELQASAGLYTHLDGPHGRVPVGQFKIGLIAAERKPHLTNHVVGDPRVGDQAWAEREGMVAFAGYPLLIGDRLVGVVAMFARHALSEVALTALAAVAQNIALSIERKRWEAELRESDQKFHQLANNISDVFWMCAPDFSAVHYVSAGYEEIWGRSAASLIAHPRQWIECILPEDREHAHAILDTLCEDQSEVSLEYRIARPDGSVRWVHDRGFQVRDAAGVLVRLIGIASDITERKSAEAELENVHRRLLETSRLAGMAEVATNVLHNVGNVLNSVNVSAALVSDGLKKSKVSSLARVVSLIEEHGADLGDFVSRDAQGKNLPVFLRQLCEQLTRERQSAAAELESLRANIDHIKDIVAMQQNYAKVSGVTEILQITDLVEDSLRMNAGALTRHDVQVVREYDEVPAISVEKHKVLQILVNLIRNAKYACDEGGRPDKLMTLRVVNGGDTVKISVIDNGVGVPPENLVRIFNHGFTTRKDGHGFGLHGGALAARELGGSLHATSAGPGQGATFILTLPCAGPSNS